MNWLTDIKTKKAEVLINEVLSESGDLHDIFTPFALCDEITNKIPSFDGNILVVANLEFVYTLIRKGVDCSYVFFATPNDLKAQVAEQMGVGGVYKYNNIITKEDVGDMKFDVVVGNPPYQNDSHVGEKQKNSQMPLWGLFVKHSIEILASNGTLAFVTPTSWLHSNSIAYKAMVSRNLLYVNLTSGKYFNVGSTNCYWVMQNNSSYQCTTFEDERQEHKMVLTPKSFIPGMIKTDFVTALSVLNRTLTEKTKLGTTISYQHDTSAKRKTLSKIKTSEFKYEIAHTNTANLWSNVKPVNGSHIKVLISLTGSLNKARVDDGKLGTTHVMGFIPTNTINEARIALSVIQSKLYKFIISSCRYSSSIPAALFKALPGVDLTRSWTNEELYEHFNLTEEEIQLIEETIK